MTSYAVHSDGILSAGSTVGTVSWNLNTMQIFSLNQPGDAAVSVLMLACLVTELSPTYAHCRMSNTIL